VQAKLFSLRLGLIVSADAVRNVKIMQSPPNLQSIVRPPLMARF
jgi:hypothetical protein